MIECEILRSDTPTRSGNVYPESVCKQIVESINSKQYPIFDNLYVDGKCFCGETVGKTVSAEYSDNAVIVKACIEENVDMDYLAPTGIAKVYDKWYSNVSVKDYELECLQVGKDYE